MLCTGSRRCLRGDNLVASGVWMEAESVEDEGRGVSFNVYVYNIQPGIEIDYSRGDSREASDADVLEKGETSDAEDKKGETYIINENTDKFHKPDCSSVSDMKARNKKEFFREQGRTSGTRLFSLRKVSAISL